LVLEELGDRICTSVLEDFHLLGREILLILLPNCCHSYPAFGVPLQFRTTGFYILVTAVQTSNHLALLRVDQSLS
jgi:hypothetical protein